MLPPPANSTSPTMTYRKDIDGLRAIAVLSVIFFHLNPSLASGGFIGVDIFFVISGFLITTQIRKDIAENIFSVKNFYFRRIRRIVPPLLAMLMATSCMAWLILEPEDIRSFVYSLIVQPFSLQNLVFLSEGDYFRGGETKVLLHTWSLAVEEQFYLFWPILLLISKRLAFKPFLAIVFTVVLGSFYLSATMTVTQPQAAFFLIFTRAWELGLGGIAALLCERGSERIKLNPTLNEVLVGLSILALAGAVFYLDSSIPFPGTAAMIPVFIAFVIVLFEVSPTSPVRIFLASRMLVWIGLISYPMYLWHWPVLVFMNHLDIKSTEAVPFLCFWVATIGLASASYQLLEKPIRQKKWLASPTRLLTVVLICFTLLIAFGIHIVATDGAAYRFEAKARAFLTARIQSYTKRCDVSALLADLHSPICAHREESSDKKRLLLWGNSHASMFIPMLKQLASQNMTSLYVNTKNSRPLVENSAGNEDEYREIMLKIKEKSITDVVFASSWNGLDSAILEQQFTNTVGELSSQNIRVWLVVDIPGGDALNPITAFNKDRNNPQVDSILLSTYNTNSRLSELSIFKRIVEKYPNVQIIDPSKVFCDSIKCWGGRGNEVWYRDATHLNNAGTYAVSDLFAPAFQ